MKLFSLTVFSLYVTTALGQSSILTKSEAMDLAMKNNLGIIVSKNEIEIGKINNSWGNAGAYPNVNFSLNRSLASNNIQQNLTTGTQIKRDGALVNNLAGNVQISWRFFDGMKMFATKHRLEEIEKMGQTKFIKQVNETFYNVLYEYYNVIRLQQQCASIKQMIELNKERLNIATTRFNIGSSGKSDMLQAEVDINEQSSKLIGIENEISQSKSNLNFLLGRTSDTNFEIIDTSLLSSNIDYSELLKKLELQNPDILLANSTLSTLLDNKKEINSQRLPFATINSNYNLNRNKSEAGFTLLNQNYGPSVSLGIGIPIFNGNNVNHQLKAMDVEIKNQVLNNQQLKNQLTTNLSNAFKNYEYGKKIAALEQKNLTIINENNKINIERFKLSAITSIELRQSQMDFTDAQTRLINALFQTKIAETEMKLLTGAITIE